MKKLILLIMIIILTLTSCKKTTKTTEVGVNDNNTQETTVMETEVKKISENNIGVKANDIKLPMINGKTFVLSELEGTPTLINIWATWCPPCVGEMPAFEKLKNEYEGKLNVIAIDYGEEEEVVKKFMKDKGYTFDVALDKTGITTKLYTFQGIPFTILVDKNGNVANIFRGSRGADAQYELYKNAIEALG